MSAIAMSNLRRRQCCAGLLPVLGGLAAGGCLTISPQEEQKLGDKEAKEVERTVGLIRDPRLVEYVQAIGVRLAKATGRTDIGWQWSVADDADANAFALPGGYVYVTRGLLALTNREDELAGGGGAGRAHRYQRAAREPAPPAPPPAPASGVRR